MAISFQNATNISGISYQGESYGASWVDFNDDDFPDLWVTNHQSLAALYLNQGNGTFTNVTSQVFVEDFPGIVSRDWHGAAWADYDNDGDTDLIQEVASDFGNTLTRFYVNEGGILFNRAETLGVATPARGRTPLWFDYDRDGLLDLNINAGQRDTAPPTVFRQNENGAFENANSLTGFNLSNSKYSFLSDLSGDGNLDLIVDSGKTIFDTSSTPFTDITNSLVGNLIKGGARDATAADFNGDLLPDLYITRKGNNRDIFQDSSSSFRTYISTNADEKGTRFKTTGDVTFTIPGGRFIPLEQIKIGASGFNPSSIEFTLSANDPNIQGIVPHTPGVDPGVFIGFDVPSQQWQLLVSDLDTYALVESTQQISQLNAIGFNPNAQFFTDQLLINTGSGFVDQSEAAGLTDVPSVGRSVVSGDFDNDMDVDIYVLTTGNAGNRDNFLYENQGNGTFEVVANAGGAAGTSLGLGDSVTTVDYDQDGFLDLFTTNGAFFVGRGDVSRAYYNDAPYELFRNQGNSNNWLQIDLEGVLSNRDGIGAQVFATAGGVTQLREQGGGMHENSQNSQQIHFGLAENTQVDLLEIRWPSGAVQQLENIAANQLITITEEDNNGTPPAIETVLYRVNAGGPQIAAIDGDIAWSADTKANNSPFLSDSGSNNTAAFPPVEPGTTVPTTTPSNIFDTERWDKPGGSEMQWAFDVPEAGDYEVRLYFGNGFNGTNDPGERIFDVAIEDNVPSNLNNIDLSDQFGHLVGGVISNTVEVTDGTLDIEFLHSVENPLVNGIEIIQIAEVTPPPTETVLYRVNAGGPEIDAIDGDMTWSGDTKANNSPFLSDPGSNSTAAFPPVEPGATVPTTTPSNIFDTERWDKPGGSEMQWAFDVPEAGDYEVRLYFGNGFNGTSDPGERIFDVAIEGNIPNNLDNIDLSSQFGHLVGGVISSTITVTDGTLDIEFLHGVQNPLVNGIEILQV